MAPCRLTPVISLQLRRLAVLLLLVGIAVLAWYPTGLQLGNPGADQVLENFWFGASCSPARYQLGWTGADSAASATGALFTGSLAAGWVTQSACRLAVALRLTPLQGALVLGLSLSFALAAITSRLHGFRPANALLVGFLICTAPFCFSRVGHLSLATAWAVVPGLLACHGLWRAMGTAQPLWRPALAGALASALCLPTQDYYVSFTLLLGLSTFALLLLLATTRSPELPPLAAAAGRGLVFGAGFTVVLVLLFSSKLTAVFAGGGAALPTPPPLWSTPRTAYEQFRYGLLPYTWLIPSLWQPAVQGQLQAAGIPVVTESYLMSTGSLLIPLGWLVAIRRLARLRHQAASQPAAGDQTFLALLLLLCTALGLLVMTMGGLGTLFAAFVSPVLRSLNRFTVFVYGASVLLLVSECELWLRHRQPGDRRRVLWGLLGLWTGVELLFSSRWWPPDARGPASSLPQPALQPGGLRAQLRALHRELGRPARVWFAPYTTYPETGFLESGLRQGVYDTFLTFPASGLTANYGAGKLSPADTLFSQASAFGLAGEWRLARQLGYEWFALDLGATADPPQARRLCEGLPGCRLSADGYALLPLTASATSSEPALLALARRLPLLPQRSAGPSWGPLVFHPLQWGDVSLRPAASPAASPTLVVRARAGGGAELFRYPLRGYPKAQQSRLNLRDADVQLVLADDVRVAQICIGATDAPTCQMLVLGAWQRRLNIGARIPAGRTVRLEVLAISRREPEQSPFALEVGGLPPPAAAAR